MGIISWIVIGLAAGWVAELVTKTSMGLVMNLVYGVVGALLGGFIMHLLGERGITGFNLTTFLVAAGGAILLVWIVNAVKSKV